LELEVVLMADAAETYVGAPITGGAVLNGLGLKWGVYTATKVTAKDWITFGDFTTIYFASACGGVVANASAESCNITTNIVYLSGAQTGAERYLVIGV
jgi:hypothetical protein